MSAACRPFFAACQHRAAATAVLPLPTSPLHGGGSWAWCAHVRRGLAHGAALRPRGEKASRFQNSSTASIGAASAPPPCRAFQAEQARLKHKQFLIDQPFPRPRQGGRVRRKWMCRSASPSGQRPRASRIRPGSGRGSVPAEAAAPAARADSTARLFSPLRLAVNRADGRAGARGEAFRRDHLALEEIGLHPAVKHIRFPPRAARSRA